MPYEFAYTIDLEMNKSGSMVITGIQFFYEGSVNEMSIFMPMYEYIDEFTNMGVFENRNKEWKIFDMIKRRKLENLAHRSMSCSLKLFKAKFKLLISDFRSTAD